MPDLNPDVLRWARETSGLTLAEAARTLQIGTARGQSPVDRLEAMESGSESPSRPLLSRMAKAYRRPLVTLYLAEPPAHGDRGEDFRTSSQDHTARQEALLDAVLRDLRSRQGILRTVVEDEDEIAPLGFIGSMTTNDGVSAVVSSIRRELGHPLDEFRRAPSAQKGFDLLRARVEEIGVFVLLLGNLGNHHTDLSVDTFRGIALADDLAPFIVINDKDARAAWSFTLLHELAHLWLGQTGISGPLTSSAQRIETFCNEIASEFLLPESEARAFTRPESAGYEALRRAVEAFAAERNISRSMVAYRFFLLGTIHQGDWQKLRSDFRREWLARQKTQREKNRSSAGGPSFYTVRAHRLGAGLIKLVGELWSSGDLTTTKAGKVLGIKPAQVGKIVGSVA